MALKDKVRFDIFVDSDDLSTIIFKPINTEIKNNSIYTLNIKDIPMVDGTTFSSKETFITTPDNYYFIPIDEVKEMIHHLKIADECILKHIIEASRTAVYWAKRRLEDTRDMPDFNSPTFQEDYYPFYMFIKHKALAETLKEFYIEMVSNPKKWQDTLSDLERMEEWDFDKLKELIDEYEREAEEWLELVVTITADPKWALRGKFAYNIYNTGTHPYHRTGWNNPTNNNFDRGF